MLTLFSIPKAFKGHIGMIQRNAIGSWTWLRPTCEVILLGNDEGTAETAREFGLRHIPEVERNSHGTPLISDIFGLAEKHGRFDRQCYVNADIVLLSDFTQAIERLSRCGKPALAVGHRWDYDQQEPLDFSPGWEDRLRVLALEKGTRQRDWLIDYFCFPRGLFGTIPPFAVGRTSWDNWLLYRARERGGLLIDISSVNVAVHQNHDYAHIKNGMQGAYKGPEAQVNLELAGGEDHCFSLKDATHVLTPQGLRRALDHDQFKRYLKRSQILHPRLKWLARTTDRYFRAPARLLFRFVDALTYQRV